MTPFGSACVVGIDAANQLWVAHDKVHVLTRTPVPLLSYGAFESVGALVHYGVHVLEDPALLGAAAAGATATAKAAAAADLGGSDAAPRSGRRAARWRRARSDDGGGPSGARNA
jgi:hypothetical protein